jgi:predicted amidohydrolase
VPGASNLVLVTGCAAVTGVLAALWFGRQSLKAAIRRASAGKPVRVAAVVVDAAPPSGTLTGLWPLESLDYRNVEATLRRYQPHVEHAAKQGARLIVLPEVSVYVEGAEDRTRWLEAVGAWARSLRVAIVAPFYDATVPVNTLIVVDERGVLASYDKQHPARGMEPARHRIVAPGPHALRAETRRVLLSTVICVDLDYSDLVRPVRSDCGILAAPSNDWFGGFEARHHRTAVWSAVMTGAPVVRAAGHGISAVFDGAGRVIAAQSAELGPVVLVADAPLGS